MEVVVGRVGRAHGVHGEAAVEVRTDEPERRFADGVVLATDPAAAGPLTVSRSRWHGRKFLVAFAHVEDRDAVEALRGVRLLAAVDPHERPADPDEYYDRQLVGLSAHDPAGSRLGVVTEVVHLPGQDLLVVTDPHDREVLVPFVRAIVVEVDVAAGRVVVDPPVGLFELSGG